MYNFLKTGPISKLYFANILFFLLFICLSLGITLSYFLNIFLLFVIAALLAFGLAYLFCRLNNTFYSDLAILLFFIFLGACIYSSSPNRDIDDFALGEHLVLLEAVSLPSHTDLRSYFRAKIKNIDGFSVSYPIKVIDYSKSIKYAHRYRLKGKLSRQKYGKRNFYTFWVKSKVLLTEVPPGFLNKVRQKTVLGLLSFFKQYSSDETQRFLGSVLLGRRELLGEEREVFANCGASHLLAISGLHVGLISCILFFILRLFYIPFRKRIIILLIFLCFYVFITGMSPSTVRAAVMYGVFAISFLLRRKVNSFNVLGLAGFFILLINPSILFNVGFQLSFAAVFAIILGFKIVSVPPCPNKVLFYIKNIVLCSCFVTVLLTPLISYYFGKLYLLSVLYNVVLIPFFTLIMAFAVIFIIFSPFHIISLSLGSVLSVFIKSFMGLVSMFASIPLTYLTYRFSFVQIFLYYILLSAALIILFYRRSTQGSLLGKGEPCN